MTSTTHDTSSAATAAVAHDGFEVLDACHIRTVFTLGKLTALVSRLASVGADPEARAMAGEIAAFFSGTARQHHQDEELFVFPKLLASGNAEIVQAVLRLKQDHAWLEEDWLELAPQVDAVACGQAWYDIDSLREGVEIFAELSRDHIALEESLIYPEARARLPGGERLQMGRAMAARRRAKKPAGTPSRPAP